MKHYFVEYVISSSKVHRATKLYQSKGIALARALELSKEKESGDIVFCETDGIGHVHRDKFTTK